MKANISRLKFLFALPTFWSSAFNAFMGVVMMKFYVDDLLLAPERLGVVSSFLSTMGLFTDILAGWLLDMLHTPFGRRRPVLLVGGPLIGIMNWLVFSPPRGLTENGLLVWLGVILACRALVPLSLAYNAFGAELSLDGNERDELFAWHHAFSLAGGLLGGGAPQVLLLLYGGTVSSRQKYSAFAGVCSVALCLSHVVLALLSRERDSREKVNGRSNSGLMGGTSLVPSLKEAFSSKPFRTLLLLYCFDALRGLLYVGLLPFYVQYVLGCRGRDFEFWISIYAMASTISAAASTPLWVRLSARIGRRRAWLAGNAICLPVGLVMFATVERGSMWLYFIFTVVIAMTAIGSGFYHQSLRASVIDYDTLRTGASRAASFATFWSLVPRWIGLPGAAVSFGIIGRLGYVPNADDQHPRVVTAINVLAALVPSLTGIMSFWLMTKFPLDEAACAAITAGIEKHRGGLEAVDPLTGQHLPPPKCITSELDGLKQHFTTNELSSLGLVNGDSFVSSTAQRAFTLMRIQALWAALCFGMWVMSLVGFITYGRVPGSELTSVLCLLLSSICFTAGMTFVFRFGAAKRISTVKKYK